jgi:precorrin-6A/cobalt-precorrin-6A reductase
VTPPKPILILGGTTEATQLVAKATEIFKVAIMTSLAGRTRQSTIPQEQVRVGGFGGVSGLSDYLRAQEIQAIVDATHPFAAQMSWNAAAAAAAIGVPHLMLVRPEWRAIAQDQWIEVDSNAAAAARLPGLAQRIFLTIGRQELATFAPLQDLWFLMRMIDPPTPDSPVPPGKLLLDRGPFSLENERSLLQTHGIQAIVSKNSGGDATYAKLVAARELQIPVIMVQRPPLPDVERAETVDAAIAWLTRWIG